MNIFQTTYDQRLQNWYELRSKIKNSDVKTICVEVDKWWQKAPLVNHYLHEDCQDIWPGPWELLCENTYCNMARGLGMIYTLCLLGIKEVEFHKAKDYNNEDVVLVLVDSAKYILNYWPDTVLNNSLQDFTLLKRIELSNILEKIK